MGGSVASKPRENCGEVQVPKILDKPILQNPKKLQKNLRFENFLGPLKIAGNRKNPNFETCSSRENWEEFLDVPVLQIPRHYGKSVFREFFGSPQNCGQLRKKSKFQNCTSQENHEKSKFQNLLLVPCQKFPNWQPTHLPLISPHICLQIWIFSHPKVQICT
jgi:hypothetical protein